MKSAIEKVKAFWEANPMFSGESRHTPGTRAFIEEYRRVLIEDDHFEKRGAQRFFPDPANRGKVLDLGCGPGFFTIELA